MNSVRGRLLFLVCVIGLVASLALPAAPAAPTAAHPAFVPRSFGIGPAAPSSSAFYLQEGGTVAALNGSPSGTTAILRANLIARTSPYSTGYELNGLSDSGDWYQLIAEDNWPGCGAGLGFAYEIWNAAGATAAPNCALGVLLLSGDQVSLTIELNCASGGANSYCLTFEDVTTGQTATASGSQPDSGGTGFVTLSTPANLNGYFTGPMTEVVDGTASACRKYASLPTLEYVIGNRTSAPTAYVPWSDEFQLTGSGATPCYAHAGVVTDVLGTPATAYTEASGGSAYGPHWVAGQDWSAVPGTDGGWRFQTDVAPLGATLSLSRTTADVGQNVTATATSSGGAAPVTCAWTAGGSAVNGTSCTTSVTASSAGSLSIHVYAIDASRNYAEAETSVTVSAAPSVQVAASPSSVLVGHALTLTPTMSGGLGPFSVDWSGLPPGCAASAGAPNVTCTPTAAGAFLVTASATDANGMVAVGTAFVTVDGGILGAPTPLVTALLAVIIVAVVVLFLILARPKRKEPTQAPPAGPLTPPVPPPPPPSQPLPPPPSPPGPPPSGPPPSP